MFIKNCPGEIHDTVHLMWENELTYILLPVQMCS